MPKMFSGLENWTHVIGPRILWKSINKLGITCRPGVPSGIVFSPDNLNNFFPIQPNKQ